MGLEPVQVLAGVFLGLPVLFVVGLILLFGVGGILGCAQCACCRLGFTRWTPGLAALPTARIARTA